MSNINNNEIIKGLRFFKSSESSNKIKPEELKNLMDKLGLKNKIYFTYNIVDTLCSNKEIKRKGGITKSEFTPYIEEKMNDLYNKEGIHALSSILKSPNNNSNKKYKYSKKIETQYEDLIKKELNINELPKNLRLDDKNIFESENLRSKYENRQKNKTLGKYNFRNRFNINNSELKNENKDKNDGKDNTLKKKFD